MGGVEVYLFDTFLVKAEHITVASKWSVTSTPDWFTNLVEGWSKFFCCYGLEVEAQFPLEPADTEEVQEWGRSAAQFRFVLLL